MLTKAFSIRTIRFRICPRERCRIFKISQYLRNSKRATPHTFIITIFPIGRALPPLYRNSWLNINLPICFGFCPRLTFRKFWINRNNFLRAILQNRIIRYIIFSKPSCIRQRPRGYFPYRNRSLHFLLWQSEGLPVCLQR